MTVVAIYSHESRKAIREQTIADFAEVGLTPSVVKVQTDPPSQLANRLNAYFTLRMATNMHPGKPVLLLEDDVIPARTLPAWLAYLEAHEERVVTLYTQAQHFLPAGTLPTKGHPRSQVGTLEALHAFHGSQALWIPPKRGAAILADGRFTNPKHEAWERALRRSPGGPWDRTLREHLIDHDETMGVAIPNVVEHRAPPSVVNRPHKRPTSVCFSPEAPPPPTRRGSSVRSQACLKDVLA